MVLVPWPSVYSVPNARAGVCMRVVTYILSWILSQTVSDIKIPITILITILVGCFQTPLFGYDKLQNDIETLKQVVKTAA